MLNTKKSKKETKFSENQLKRDLRKIAEERDVLKEDLRELRIERDQIQAELEEYKRKYDQGADKQPK